MQQPHVTAPATDEIEVNEELEVIDGRTVLEHLEDEFAQTVVLAVEDADVSAPATGVLYGLIAGAMLWGVLLLLAFWLL